MSKKNTTRVGGAIATVALIAGLGITASGTASADAPQTRGTSPNGCSIKTNVSHQDGAVKVKGKCGSTKLSGKQKWTSGTAGSGKINSSKYTYRYGNGNNTNLKGKIGKHKVTGKLKFHSNGSVPERFQDSGSIRFRGKTYKVSIRGTWSGGNTNFKSVSVKAPNGKRLAAKNTVRTYISIIVTLKHLG